MSTGSQCRLDDLGEVLGAVGGEQQRLTSRCERNLTVQDEVSDRSTRGCIAWLKGEYRIECLSEQPSLRALAAPIHSFEHDPQTVHLLHGERSSQWRN